MLYQYLCEFSEYKIYKVFEYSDDGQIKGLWYDSVLLNQPDRS